MINIALKCLQDGVLVQEPYAASQAEMRQKPPKTKKPGTQSPRQKNELNRFTCEDVTRFNGVISVKVNFADLTFGGTTQMAKSCPQSLETRLSQWLKSHDNMNGSKVLIYLMEHPNTKLHVSFLDRCTFTGNWPEPDEFAMNGFESQPRIPMVDKITVKQCRNRAEALIKEIKGAVDLNDLALEAKLKLEYELLMKYLYQVTTPSHKIKNFDAGWKPTYHNVYTCVWKAIRKMRTQAPDLAAYVNRRLKTGRCFVWKTPPLKPKMLHIQVDIASVDFNPGIRSNVM